MHHERLESIVFSFQALMEEMRSKEDEMVGLRQQIQHVLQEKQEESQQLQGELRKRELELQQQNPELFSTSKKLMWEVLVIWERGKFAD